MNPSTRLLRRAALLPVLTLAVLAIWSTVPASYGFDDDTPGSTESHATQPTVSSPESGQHGDQPDANDTPAASSASNTPDNQTPPPPPPPPPQVPTPDKSPHHSEPGGDNDRISIANSSHVGPGEVVGDNVTIMGSNFVEGVVNGDSVVVMGENRIAGVVQGDAVAVGGRLILESNAVVNGDAVSVGGTLDRAPGAVVHGQVTEVPFPGISLFHHGGFTRDWFDHTLGMGRLFPPDVRWGWGIALFFFAFNLVLAAVFRRPITAATALLDKRPVSALFAGILVLLLTGPLFLLLVSLVITIVAIPFLAAAIFLMILLGTIAVYRYTGQAFGLHERPMLALIVGQVLFFVLFAIPILGLLVWMTIVPLGLGGFILAMTSGNGKRNGTPTPAAPADPETPAAPEGPAAQATESAVLAVPLAPLPPEPPPSPPPPANPAPVAPAAGATPAAPPRPAAGSRAGFFPRIGANVLDLVLVGTITLFTGLQSAFLLLWLIYHVGFWTWRATTIGGFVFNLRIARMDGRPVDFGIALTRLLGSIFSFVALGLGFLWVLWDSEFQSWHDKIAGTTIVRTPPGTPLI